MRKRSGCFVSSSVRGDFNDSSQYSTARLDDKITRSYMYTADLHLDSSLRLISLNIRLEGPNAVAGRQLNSGGPFKTTLFAGFTLTTTPLLPLTSLKTQLISHMCTWPLATSWPVIRNITTRLEMKVQEAGGHPLWLTVKDYFQCNLYSFTAYFICKGIAKMIHYMQLKLDVSRIGIKDHYV